MAENALYEVLMRQLSAAGSIRRELVRIVSADCSDDSDTVPAVLGRHGAMRIGGLTELLGVDPSATSRHIAQLTMLLVPSRDVQTLTDKEARSFRAWVAVDNAKAIA
ncbi:hypothetical protein ABZS93_12735 [Streptomyces sp900116325]|uniref:hypothetical protein n=1 Tax=Streptomyces sp. 900116325 TaxID=3154295 RepID=UPI0033ABE554